jgi:zinc-binding alcohol dehydrogenase/oxidoreductase
VLGSDGSGYDEDENEVIINPGFDFGNDERAQGNRFNMLGMPANGTLAQYVSVHQKYIFPKPEHLTLEQAAALPLAGLTAYRALFVRGMYQPEERVLITGIGGGVALFAMQYALACGSEVWVTSSSDEKIARAVEMGAKGGVNYKDENWHKSLTEKKIFFDVIVDGAAGAGFSKLLTVCNPGARIAVYGGTAGKIESISPQVLFWKQITIAGSTMGSEKDFAEMLAFVNEKKIVPVVSKTFEMEEAQAAFDYMGKGEQFGKPVIRID